LLGAAKFANEVVGRRPCRRFPALARVPRSAKCSKRVNRPKRAGLGNRGLIIYNRGGFSRRKAITIPSTKPRIAIASDHAGFSVKETIRRHLESAGYAVSDLGTSSEESVDYPDYGKAVGERVVSKQADLGIAVCGTGMGISIAANKVPGVRAALAHDLHTARLAREHNDANVLALGGRVVSGEAAIRMVQVFLTTAYLVGRHQRRVDKISAIEKQERAEAAKR
jgi:ribose 5-phosphate isomerase B